jgi:predicted O-methyltransferase YrrM
LEKERDLPGIDWNVAEQLQLLEKFEYNGELRELLDSTQAKPEGVAFSLNNGAFESGDAEYFYSIIRQKKPQRIFEIGSGNSTLVALSAIKKNKLDDPRYACKHVCIEPYEMPWLESVNVEVLRQRVENVDKTIFSELGEDDILFIDSSHIIRPQGDVLFEYLELLPRLNPGVIVHIHDIFSPRDYLKQWVIEEVKFWNEQYVLEAFLTENPHWKVIGALNYLHHNYYDKLHHKCPFLTKDREPGSFYIQKIAARAE